MKTTTHTSGFWGRLLAMLDTLFIRHTGSDKLRDLSRHHFTTSAKRM